MKVLSAENKLELAMNRWLTSVSEYNSYNQSWAREFRFGSLGFLKSSDWFDALTLMHHHITYTPIYSLSHLTY